jgi:hypothetical protein
MQQRTPRSIVFFAIVLLLSFAPLARSDSERHFQREQTAQRHCPKDVVVWVNTRSGVYHFKGERWYGATKQGCFECRKEADAEGDRPTRNGQ